LSIRDPRSAVRDQHMRILFIADISGSSGRRAVSRMLGVLRSRHGAHLVVANGENAAGGLGITRPTATALLDAGVDAMTLGNHAFAKKDAFELVGTEPRLLRPANYPPEVPGRGWGVFSASDGDLAAVCNLLGRTFMNPIDCPFRAADAMLSDVNRETGTVLIDMHAEATSEKKAMGYYLAGRASAVVGTHTHIQTSDEVVMPEGTAYITDAGMTGVQDSVLGLDKSMAVQRFLTQVAGKFELAEGPATLQGVLIDVDSATGRATGIARLSVGEWEL